MGLGPQILGLGPQIPNVSHLKESSESSGRDAVRSREFWRHGPGHMSVGVLFFGVKCTAKHQQKRRKEKGRVTSTKKQTKKEVKTMGLWVVRYIRMWESRSMRSQLELSGTLSQGQRTEPLAAGAPQR